MFGFLHVVIYRGKGFFGQGDRIEAGFWCWALGFGGKMYGVRKETIKKSEYRLRTQENIKLSLPQIHGVQVHSAFQSRLSTMNNTEINIPAELTRPAQFLP